MACMYILVRTYIYIYMYICVYIFIYVHTYLHICMLLVYICTHTYMRCIVCTYVLLYVCMYGWGGALVWVSYAEKAASESLRREPQLSNPRVSENLGGEG